MTAEAISEITVARLISDYDALLLDAFGVLVDAQGALPGAPELIRHLNRGGHPYWVVTNDASKMPATAEARFRRAGLDIEVDRIVTAGSLLSRYFEDHALAGAPCAVIGPPDSLDYVRDAGGEIVDWGDPSLSRVEALIVQDEGGFDFMPRMNDALSLLFNRLDRGAPVRLILPNPDLIYPAAPGRYGFTAGSMAMWFEAALALRYPELPLQTFDRLGKPYPAIYEAALERAQTDRVVMVGDQLETDIQGARAVGLDAALVTFGLTRDALGDVPAHLRPTFVLRSWSL